jgi:hypothetical protein
MQLEQLVIQQAHIRDATLPTKLADFEAQINKRCPLLDPASTPNSRYLVV